MPLGHQPFIFDAERLYYCTAAGSTSYGTEWRVSLNGTRVGPPEGLTPGCIVECNPFVSFGEDLYRLSFIGRPEIGVYRLVIVDSRDDRFQDIVTIRQRDTKCFSAFSNFTTIYSYTLSEVVTLHQTDLSSGRVLHEVVSEDLSRMHKAGLKLFRLSQDPSTGNGIVTVYASDDCFCSYLIDLQTGAVLSQIRNNLNQPVYKCHLNGYQLAYAKKNGPEFEDREIVVETLP